MLDQTFFFCFLFSLNTDFVCWRGLMTRLLCTPYENRDSWKIAVTKFKNTLFMCEFETEQKVQHQSRMSAREKEMTYWGYKFEQYLTSGNDVLLTGVI